jgi:GNAT superfamily N-acetyltransferase
LGPTDSETSSVIIRPAQLPDAEAIARVQVDTWRTAYKGIMPENFLADLSYEQNIKRWQNILADPNPNRFGYVAESDSETIVGFALGGAERNGDPDYVGELYAIYLLESFQRQGIGRRLIATLAQRLVGAGLPSLLVWVLEGNPCRGFYEMLGGKHLRQKLVTVGGAQLVEIAYGWQDARRLIEH